MAKSPSVYDRAKYEAIISEGRVLEAVYRLQTAGTDKTCAAEQCGLGRDIKVYTDYARVFFPDTGEVEFFHYGCFKREFKPDA